jgi:hypothetical protein
MQNATINHKQTIKNTIAKPGYKTWKIVAYDGEYNSTFTIVAKKVEIVTKTYTPDYEEHAVTENTSAIIADGIYMEFDQYETLTLTCQ